MDLGTLLRFVLVPWPSCCSSGRRNGSSAASSREVLGLMLCGVSNGDRRRPTTQREEEGSLQTCDFSPAPRRPSFANRCVSKSREVQISKQAIRPGNWFFHCGRLAHPRS